MPDYLPITDAQFDEWLERFSANISANIIFSSRTETENLDDLGNFAV